MIKIYLDDGSSCFSNKESFEDFFKAEGPFLKYGKYGFYEIDKYTMINIYHVTKVELV